LTSIRSAQPNWTCHPSGHGMWPDPTAIEATTRVDRTVLYLLVL
jgi:hypothetical protein